MGRRAPYTERGISRVRCEREGCRRPGRYQWQICADGRLFRVLCERCDIALNALVMRWAFGRTREADIRAYAKRVEAGR